MIEPITTVTTTTTTTNPPVEPESIIQATTQHNDTTITATSTNQTTSILRTPSPGIPTIEGGPRNNVTFGDNTIRPIIRNQTQQSNNNPTSTNQQYTAPQQANYTGWIPASQQANGMGAFAGGGGVATGGAPINNTPNIVLPPPTPAVIQQPPPSASGEPDWMQRLLTQQANLAAQQGDSMAKLIQLAEGGTNSHHTNDGQGWQKRFPLATRRALLFMSAASKQDVPDEPNEEFKAFLEISSTQIVTSAQQSVNDARMGSQTIDKPYATAIHNLRFHSINPDVPSGISLFFANPAFCFNGTETMSEAEFNMRKELNTTVNAAQLASLTKSSIGIPTTLGDLKDTISNQTKLFSWITTENAHLFLVIFDFLKAMDTYHYAFAACVNEPSTQGLFIPALMARIDRRFTNFMMSCQRATSIDQVEFHIWNFDSELDKIKLGDGMKAPIPQAVKSVITKYAAEKEKKLEAAVQKRERAAGGAGGNQRDRNQRQRGGGAGRGGGGGGGGGGGNNAAEKPAINKDKTYALGDRESTAIYHRNLDSAPTLNDQKPCLRYLLKSSCNFGEKCNYTNWHTSNLPDETKTSLTKWIAQCKTKYNKDNKF
jgi:uncharacterized membrane protein YgcG